MECYSGSTDMAVYLWFANTTLEECDECKAPLDDDEDAVAYYFELPCDPICESSAPTDSPKSVPPPPITDCYDPYTILEEDTMNKTGAEIILPDNAIKIIDGNKDELTIEISQLWLDNTAISLFTQYDSKEAGNVCEGTEVQFEDTLTKTMECYAGWAEFSIVAYIDAAMSIEDCAGCNSPEDGDDSAVAYYFEIPCKPICESESPTEAPTVSVAPSSAPTDCYDKYGITEADIIDQFGPPETQFPENAVKIINGENDSAIIEVSNLWSDSASIFLHYHQEGHGSVCENITEFEYEDTINRSLECYEGWTDLAVFVYVDDELTMEECEECKPPEPDDESTVAFYFEISCEPICEDFAALETTSAGPEETGCYDGISVTRKQGEDSVCGIDQMPFVVEEYGSDQMKFSFTNHWASTMDTITLLYPSVDGIDESQSLNSLAPEGMYPNALTAACDPVSQTTEVQLQISNTDGSCSLVYQLPCSVDVVICGDSDSNRKLEDVVSEQNVDDDEDTPFCAHKDYPCKGDEENMVYVCHYSSRAGYQTFCMPEMDSDVIRFNKNHHCGPCDGWNGIDQTAQMN